MPSLAFSEPEIQALTELVNLGMSRAAGAFRQLVGEPIQLSAPSIALVSYADAIQSYGEKNAAPLVAVRQNFSGDISGSALLILPQDRSLELTRLVLGGGEGASQDMEQDVFAEMGNILLNGYLGTIANMLARTLTVALPEFGRGYGLAIFNDPAPAPPDGIVVSQCIHFSVRGRDIKTDLLMLMDVPALDVLKDLLAEFLDRADRAGAVIGNS